MDDLRNSIAREDWQSAEQELTSLWARSDVDPIAVRFIAGFVALGQGQLKRAAEYFREILNRRPELHRVRLELARTLFLLGDDPAASYHFELVRVADIPEQVQRKIDGYLNAIRRRRLWSVEFGVGLSPDSNINTGSRNETVTIGGLPFELSSDAQETSGLGLYLSFGGYRAWQATEQWSARLMGSAVRRDYRKSRFDDMSLRLSAGAVYTGEWGEVQFAPVGVLRYFGNDIYARSAGARVEWAWRLNPAQAVDASLERLDNNYVADDRRDGYATIWTIGQRIVLGPTSVLRMGVDLYRERTQEPSLGSTTIGVGMGHYGEYGLGISCELQWRASTSDYDAPDLLFGKVRSDQMVSFAGSVSRRNWRIAGFTPVLSYTFIRNSSNIELYEFDRHQYLLGMQRQF